MDDYDRVRRTKLEEMRRRAEAIRAERDLSDARAGDDGTEDGTRSTSKREADRTRDDALYERDVTARKKRIRKLVMIELLVAIAIIAAIIIAARFATFSSIAP